MAQQGPGHGPDPDGLDVDALYAAPPARFVEERKRLARALRAAGRRAEAQAIEKLTRPTVSVWATNQLARRERARVSELLELTDRLRDIQGRGDGGAFAETADRHRAVLAALRTDAERLLGADGHPATPQLLASRGGEPARGRRGSRAADEPGRWPTGRRRGRQRVSRAAGGWNHRPERPGTNTRLRSPRPLRRRRCPILRTPKQRRPDGGRRRRPPAPPSGPRRRTRPRRAYRRQKLRASWRKPRRSVVRGDRRRWKRPRPSSVAESRRPREGPRSRRNRQAETVAAEPKPTLERAR